LVLGVDNGVCCSVEGVVDGGFVEFKDSILEIVGDVCNRGFWGAYLWAWPIRVGSDLRLPPVCLFGVDQRLNEDIWMVVVLGHAVCVLVCLDECCGDHCVIGSSEEGLVISSGSGWVGLLGVSL